MSAFSKPKLNRRSICLGIKYIRFEHGCAGKSTVEFTNLFNISVSKKPRDFVFHPLYKIIEMVQSVMLARSFDE